MSYKLNQQITNDMKDLHQDLVNLTKEICKIPAPSNFEDKRAEFCKEWFAQNGIKNAYIDEALNVVVPYNYDETKDLVVFMAHTDTVFPDTSPMPMKEENGRLCCPGVGDDTANLAILMQIAKYVVSKNLKPDYGILFVCNTGEEGLGNLKGSKKIIEKYGKQVKYFYSFDGTLEGCYNYSVGSVRYKVEIKTEGGHSFSDFGNKNAIAYMSSLINLLYTVKVPKGGKTTFNVGKISGGTSVNTIAQQVEMFFEYRSDVKEHLDTMIKLFESAIETYKNMGIEVNVEVIGLRPCMGDVDKTLQKKLEENIVAAASTYFEEKVEFSSGSTDCNIPFSVGIPSCAIGGYIGGGAHTREEWIDIESLKKGFPYLMSVVLDYFRKSNVNLYDE
ncbi:MAG: M20/M25/M40 family metallo-hydrolase [Fusobacteriaceae bacterium]|jgi:acetylornithine deacetylase/succinyl-diaminopimelate desuccinylase-like protein|nr:M20/M25/M40 family metallo-hydrolase [Fusobacteriaceae bacterium]